jgi:NAD(P)-dependent dehydrogenase (short-subunit alcohol dehydrogenase family)
MSKKLQNKVALITGGTTGIGLATAHLFAEEGARVFVTGQNPETIARAKQELAGIAEVIRSDASDSAQLRSLISHIQQSAGGLDVLFLNAGVAKFAPITDFSEEEFDQLFSINVKGPFLAIKHAVPALRRGASIILNTSISAETGMPAASIYSATKAALRSLARTASADLVSRGIRVNAVSPGPIETPIFGKLGLPAEAIEGFAASVKSQNPLGRFGQAREIATAALFLASDDSSYMVGAEIVVDGGRTQL